jgi:hypothetical protein
MDKQDLIRLSQLRIFPAASGAVLSMTDSLVHAVIEAWKLLGNGYLAVISKVRETSSDEG